MHASAKTGAESLASAARQCDGCDGSGWNRARRWDLALASLAMTNQRSSTERCGCGTTTVSLARQHHVDRERRGRRRQLARPHALDGERRVVDRHAVHHHRVALARAARRRSPLPPLPPTPPVVGGDGLHFVAGGVGVRPSKLVAFFLPASESAGVAADIECDRLRSGSPRRRGRASRADDGSASSDMSVLSIDSVPGLAPGERISFEKASKFGESVHEAGSGVTRQGETVGVGPGSEVVAARRRGGAPCRWTPNSGVSRC